MLWRPKIDRWLDAIDPAEPLGVEFSGGIDSGSVFLVLYHRLLARGESPARLKAFTLAIGDEGPDLSQARQFLRQLDLELFLEPIVVPQSAIDYRDAIRVDRRLQAARRAGRGDGPGPLSRHSGIAIPTGNISSTATAATRT